MIPSNLNPTPIFIQLRRDAGCSPVARWKISANSINKNVQVVAYLRHKTMRKKIFELRETTYILPATGKTYTCHALYESAAGLPAGAYRDTTYQEIRGYRIPNATCSLGDSVVLSSKNWIQRLISSPQGWVEVFPAFSESRNEL